MGDDGDELSLWQMLGVSRETVAPPLADEVWSGAMEAALDPAAPEADDAIVPVYDEDAGISGWGVDLGADAGAGGADGPDHDVFDDHPDSASHGLAHTGGHDDLGSGHDHDPGHDHPDLGAFDDLGDFDDLG